MDGDTILSVLKWIALAFAAGLIGYFGKYLGKMIIARFSKKDKIDSQPAVKTVGNDGLGGHQKKIPDISKNKSPKEEDVPAYYSEKKAELDYKLEKKRVKAEQKRLKKLGGK